MLISSTLFLFFQFLIVNARHHHSETPSRRSYFLKGVIPSDVLSHSALNTVSHHQLTKGLPSEDPTAQVNDSANPPLIPNAAGDHNNASAPKGYPEPSRNDTSRCSGPSGKLVTFNDRDCWYAAKVMAEDSASISQCGNCVLGLYDDDKKKSFKPTEPLNVTFLQGQAMDLLNQCKNNAQKVTKRDSSPTDSSDEGTNVQLLMGYKPESKSCPGL